MTIILSADLEARLKQRAATEGKDPEAVAEALLFAALEAKGPTSDLWEGFGGDAWPEVRENIRRFREAVAEDDKRS